MRKKRCHSKVSEHLSEKPRNLLLLFVIPGIPSIEAVRRGQHLLDEVAEVVEAEAVDPGKRVLDRVAALVDALANRVVLRPEHVGPKTLGKLWIDW